MQQNSNNASNFSYVQTAIEVIPFKVAFGHKARVGKDTACEYLNKLLHGKNYRFADPVYDIGGLIQDYLGKPRVKDPLLLQTIGLKLREVYHSNIWVDTLLRKLAEDSGFVNLACVPDMRFKNEMEALKAAEFVTIKINRANRIIDRDPNHPSEIDLDDGVFDFTINNDFNPEHLYGVLNTIMWTRYQPSMKIMGYVYHASITGNIIYTGTDETSIDNITYTAFSKVSQDDAVNELSELLNKILGLNEQSNLRNILNIFIGVPYKLPSGSNGDYNIHFTQINT